MRFAAHISNARLHVPCIALLAAMCPSNSLHCFACWPPHSNRIPMANLIPLHLCPSHLMLLLHFNVLHVQASSGFFAKCICPPWQMLAYTHRLYRLAGCNVPQTSPTSPIALLAAIRTLLPIRTLCSTNSTATLPITPDAQIP